MKVPQEYWIHFAQRDMTDTIVEDPAVGVAIALVVIVLLGVLQFVVRPRLPASAWGWRFAADPLVTSARDAHERYAQRLRRGRVVWGELAEKVALLGLLGMIFASTSPEMSGRGSLPGRPRIVADRRDDAVRRARSRPRLEGPTAARELTVLAGHTT